MNTLTLAELGKGVIFDPVDEEGIILDSDSGRYLELNAVATLMLQACLRFDTLGEVVDQLLDRIDASEDTLEVGVKSLMDQLDAFGLVAKR